MTERTRRMVPLDGEDREKLARLGFRAEPGWQGVFTRSQYALAQFNNGDRVVKLFSEEGDTHPTGAEATVLGSIGAPGVGVGYFVEYDDDPKVATFVQSSKIERAS